MVQKLVTVFDVDQNFWEANPQFKVAFKALYKADRSRGKKDSSNQMWFVAFTHDQGSIYYNLPVDEKYNLIGEDFLGDINYYSKQRHILDDLIKQYVGLTMTASERHLDQWRISLDDRTNFLSTVKYDLENFDKLDKMAANTKAVFDTFKRIQEDIIKEQSGGGDAKGGYKESLNDTGEI
jgi:hypothetical protein